MKKRTIALLAAMVLLVGCVIGGTIAWLTDKTQEVKNTFTVGNIDITLEETGTTSDNDGNDAKSYKMIPGTVLEKDPKVTVVDGSEDCYLFVEVIETAPKKADGTVLSFDTYLSYEMESGWKKLGDSYPGVYYREVKADDTVKAFDVIGTKVDGEFVANKILVNDTVTKEDMDALKDGTLPQLTFKAYAVQKDNVDTVEDAWTIAQG